MKNANYNLVKLLHNALDDSWRIERHYLKDARVCKNCSALMKKMSKQINDNTAALQKEIARHMGGKGKLM